MLYQRKDIIASKKQPAANSCKGELRHIKILSVRKKSSFTNGSTKKLWREKKVVKILYGHFKTLRSNH